MFRYFLLLLLLISNSAVAFESDWFEQEHIKARVVQNSDGVAIEIEPEHGWHTYAKDPGEAGVATSFDFSGSKNINIKDVIYPEHKEIDEFGIKTFGYDSLAVFKLDADISSDAELSVKISGAVCKDICIPYEIEIKDIAVSASSAGAAISFSIMLTALLAGLILNVMPCVLPVLSLKILSVVKQGGKESAHARLNFLFTAFGIVFSFLALAAIAVSLKASGEAIGWGLHFQSPYFVGTLLVITLLFALSLFGVFYIRPPSWLVGEGAHKDSLAGNFISGVVATLLGTSCTAPVVVTAVGFALAGSNADIITIFFVMGIGMAAPFLLFTALPNLTAYLPKPGAWMIRIKNIMGILLLGTAVWLGSILYDQVVENKVQQGEWQVFDEAKIPEYVADGKTVFVDITAEWCVNCKANKIAVIDTKEIMDFFHENSVVLVRGDMTSPQKHLLEYIKKFDKYGIPVNVVYGPNAPNGIVLQPLLTKNAVKEAVSNARK